MFEKVNFIFNAKKYATNEKEFTQFFDILDKRYEIEFNFQS